MKRNDLTAGMLVQLRPETRPAHGRVMLVRVLVPGWKLGGGDDRHTIVTTTDGRKIRVPGWHEDTTPTHVLVERFKVQRPWLPELQEVPIGTPIAVRLSALMRPWDDALEAEVIAHWKGDTEAAAMALTLATARVAQLNGAVRALSQMVPDEVLPGFARVATAGIAVQAAQVVGGHGTVTTVDLAKLAQAAYEKGRRDALAGVTVP